MTDCTKQTTQIMKHENEYDPPQKKNISIGSLKKEKKTQKNDKNIRYNS